MKVGLITSTGGHLFQLWRIQKAWEGHQSFFVTFNKEDARNLLKKQKIYFAHYPESRNIINAIKNTYLAFMILKKERPNLLISAGAGIAPPFFIWAKFFKIRTMYIEPVDFIKKPSLTGRILYFLADVFLVQDVIQKKWFPNAKFWGSTL